MSKPVSSLVSSVMRQAWRLTIAEPLVLIILIMLVAVPNIIIGYWFPGEEYLPLTGWYMLVTLFIQITAMRRTIIRQGWIEIEHEATRGFYPRAFVQSLFFGIASFFGLLFLVIPGVIIMVRWSLSLPILLARDSGVVEGFRESWHLTRGHFWPLWAVGLLSLVPALAVLLWSILDVDIANTLPGVILFELVFAASWLFGWYVQIAAYRYIKNHVDLPS